MLPPDSGRTGDFLMAFLSILFQGAPFLMAGTLVSGLLEAFLPTRGLDRWLPKNKVLATFAAGVAGLILPVCKGAVAPVLRRLVHKGLPASCALTYLLAASIVNPIVILGTWLAFQKPQMAGDVTHLVMTGGRVSLGFLIAVLAGLTLLFKKPADLLQPGFAKSIPDLKDGSTHMHEAGFEAKLVHAMRTAMRDFLDMAIYFTWGVIIVAVINTQVDQAKLLLVAGHPALGAPVLMVLAYILGLDSSTDAFIAAPMQAFSLSAKLAFLVFGPMLDIKLTFMYLSVFRGKVLAGLAVLLFVLAAILSGPSISIFQRIFSHISP